MAARDEDDKLLKRLKRRDEAAFTELVRSHQERVFGLTLRMLGDRAEAEDLAQEVFVTVFKSIDGFRGDSRLSTWLYRVTINHCKNRLKYLGRRGRGAQREFDDDRAHAGPSGTVARIAGPEAQLQGREAERIVQRALAELPDEQRELVVLRDIESLSYEEIREITGLVEGTVKSRLHRARLALHARVTELSKGPTRGES